MLLAVWRPWRTAAHRARGAQHRDLRTRDGLDEPVLLSVARAAYRSASRWRWSSQVRWRSPWRHRIARSIFCGSRWPRRACWRCCRWDSAQSRCRRPASASRSPPECAGLSTSSSDRRPERCTAGEPPRSARWSAPSSSCPSASRMPGTALFSPALLPLGVRGRVAVERAAVFAGDVRAAAPADAHLRRAHELVAGTRRAVRACAFSPSG